VPTSNGRGTGEVKEGAGKKKGRKGVQREEGM